MKKILVLIFAILFVGNIYSQKKEIPAELVNRSWSKIFTTSPSTHTLIFYSDSTFSYTNPENDISASAKCKFDDGIITFPPVGCPDESKYRFTISGDELNIQLVNDSCLERREILIGIWKSLKTENK